MRKNLIQEIENYLKDIMQLFTDRTGIELQESTVQKTLSIILDAYNLSNEIGLDTEVKITHALDDCQTEEEFVIFLKKITREDERIYFNVPHTAKKLAKFANCFYDSEKKLWYTYSNNELLSALVGWYEVHGATSKKAMKLLKAKTEIQ